MEEQVMVQTAAVVQCLQRGGLVMAHERASQESGWTDQVVDAKYACRVSPRGGPAGRPEGFDAARNFWASKSAIGPQHQASGKPVMRSDLLKHSALQPFS